jgi:hypothetical protein
MGQALPVQSHPKTTAHYKKTVVCDGLKMLPRLHAVAPFTKIHYRRRKILLQAVALNIYWRILTFLLRKNCAQNRRP